MESAERARNLQQTRFHTVWKGKTRRKRPRAVKRLPGRGLWASLRRAMFIGGPVKPGRAVRRTDATKRSRPALYGLRATRRNHDGHTQHAPSERPPPPPPPRKADPTVDVKCRAGLRGSWFFLRTLREHCEIPKSLGAEKNPTTTHVK